MKSVTISYEGTLQAEELRTSDEDRYAISKIDNEEVDVMARLNWITPKNVINKNMFHYQYNSAWYILTAEETGDYSEQEIAINLINRLNRELQIALDDQNTICYVDKNDLVYRSRLVIIRNDQLLQFFRTDDYWLAKLIGCKVGQAYGFDNENRLQFDRKMFTGIARMLNVVCYQGKEATGYERRKNRFNMIKQPYQFPPGSNSIVSSNFPMTFSINQLQTGVSIHICDENFEDLVLEGETYYLDLVIQKSSRRMINEQADVDKRAQNIEEMRIIQQQQDEEEAQMQAELQQSRDRLNDDLTKSRADFNELFKDVTQQYWLSKQGYEQIRGNVARQYKYEVKQKDLECKKIEAILKQINDKQLDWNTIMEEYHAQYYQQLNNRDFVAQYEQAKSQYEQQYAMDRKELVQIIDDFNFDQITKLNDEIVAEDAKHSRMTQRTQARIDASGIAADEAGRLEDEQEQQAKQFRLSNKISKRVQFAPEVTRELLTKEHEDDEPSGQPLFVSDLQMGDKNAGTPDEEKAQLQNELEWRKSNPQQATLLDFLRNQGLTEDDIEDGVRNASNRQSQEINDIQKELRLSNKRLNASGIKKVNTKVLKLEEEREARQLGLLLSARGLTMDKVRPRGEYDREPKIDHEDWDLYDRGYVKK